MDIPRELARLIRESPNLRGLLDQAVTLVAQRMGVEVCSIYLLDPVDQRLWLVASHGFRPEAVGESSLGLGEGLTGRVVSGLRTLAVADAPSHPDFHYFPETGEELFHSYLGEPLALGGRPVGSIVLRTRESREFSTEERDTLSALASQLVGLVENVRLMEALARPEKTGRAYWREVDEWNAPASEPPGSAEEGLTLHGAPISAGIVIAEAVVVGGGTRLGAEEGPFVPAEELERLQRALGRAREELAVIRESTRREAGEHSALIFGSHLLILSDESLLEKLSAAIAAGSSAGRAVESVFAETAARLLQVPDPYLRERADDVHELCRRLIGALAGADEGTPPVEGRVAVVPVLSASVVVELNARGAVGILAAHGGQTSHGALLARSFDIPTVAGVLLAPERVSNGETIVLDGTEGTIVIRPGDVVERTYRRAIDDQERARVQRESLRDLEAITRDGHHVTLLANVGLTGDLRLAAQTGAEGVGLFRTEMPFLLRDTMPSRAEQTQIYSRAFEALPGRPVVFRTLDLGGDKYLGRHIEREANPFLGYRSIRISLDRPEEFIVQVQAFMIAALGRDGRIMLPLVSSVDEVRGARELIRRASELLVAEEVLHNDAMPLGVMIEVPAAVEIAAALAREVAFFSIGTNDLIQYALAVDRGNERVAHLSDPWHPAVLSMVHRTVRAGHAAGISVSVCGEMAGDPESALILVGLGVDSLSMNSIAIPGVKEAIRGASHAELCHRAGALQGLPRAEEIRAAWRSGQEGDGASPAE